MDAIFFWIPKTGGCSIRECFNIQQYLRPKELNIKQKHSGLITFSHMSVHTLLSLELVNQRFVDKSFKFTFCRNPYTRAVSLFSYLKSLRWILRKHSFLDFCRQLAIHNVRPIGTRNSWALIQANPQVRWIEDFRMDFIGRFESLQSDMLKLKTQLGLATQALPHLNKGIHKPYSHYYANDECRQLIADYYADDFYFFGYPLELPPSCQPST